MPIYLTATLKAKPNHLAEVKSVLENMVVQTLKETACLQYDLHQSITDKNLFVFYEIWENEEGLDLHNQQPYIKAFRSLADERLEEQPIVHLLSKL